MHPELPDGKMTGMKKVVVNLGPASYEVRIGADILERTGLWIKELRLPVGNDKAVIITDTTVRDLHAGKLRNGLENAGFQVEILAVPAGEAQKNLDTATRLYAALANMYAERLTPVFALGGGVIGDLAGFVAATYLRGVPLIQVPTTLLAQVDSSIGGKVAVNHGRLKNNIGAFYQPEMVIADISTLKTLPVKEFKNGLAEIIKYGVIKDVDLFKILESDMSRLKSFDEELLEEIISRCAGIKAAVVEEDEKDTGIRNILNYGHTVGHAIETVSDFKIKHGRAVAVGMVAEGMISHSMGFLPYSAVDKIKSVLTRAGIPINIPGLDVSEVIKTMEHDKKKVDGKIKFVFPKSIGEVLVSSDVNMRLVEQVLKDLYEEAPDLRHNNRE